MTIISRYLSKEVLHTMLGVTSLAVFIFICNQFVKYLDFVATGKYAANMLFHLLLFYVPILFALLLPLGLFLGILLGYGRLYVDSEMIVLATCGMSRRRLLRITMSYALGVMVIVGGLVLWINPIVAKHRDRLMDLAETSSVFQTIMPGRFQSSSKGQQVFYVQKMSRDRTKMKNIFIAQRLKRKAKDPHVKTSNWVVISAKTGYEMIDRKTGDRFMVARNGYRYEGAPGQNKFRVVKYDTYGVRMSPPLFSGRNEGVEVLSMGQLLKGMHKDREHMAELQWRLSMPLSVIILALLAIPLSRVSPRQGRFVQLIPAVLIYIIYANMLFASRTWLEDGAIPAWIGLWWIHLLVLSLALWLLSKNPLAQNKTPFYLRWLKQ